MTGSIRGLIGLAIAGLALLIALVASEPRRDHGDRTVLAFDPTRVTGLSWGDVRLTRTGQGWAFVGAPDTPVVARAVDDVLSSLRAARWHRQKNGEHHVRRTLEITGDAKHQIGIAETLAGTDQTWIVVDGVGYLVDGWLAKLLDPNALAFRDPTPLAAAATAQSIAVDEVALFARPWRTKTELVRPELGEALAGALAKLQVVGTTTLLGQVSSKISIDGLNARVSFGECGDGVAIAVGTAAPVCAKGWADVVAAKAALAGDATDRRPAGFAFDRVGFGDGELVLAKQPTIAIRGVVHPADRDRIAELQRALAEPGEVVAVPATAPAFTLAIAPVMLDVFADVVHRRGEPHALRISGEARAILARTPIELVDAERWSEEPTTITQIDLDKASYKRGAVIGEWNTDSALVEALANSVAKLHAPARAGSAPTPHHLRFIVSPPVGDATTHELSLGAPTATGCPAVIAGEAVTAPLELCVAVAALAH